MITFLQYSSFSFLPLANSPTIMLTIYCVFEKTLGSVGKQKDTLDSICSRTKVTHREATTYYLR